MQLYLNFHEHIILVSSNEEVSLSKIRNDFSFFEQKSAKHVDTLIEIFHKAPPEIPPLVAEKVLEDYTVYRIGPKSYIQHRNKALLVWDSQEEILKIYSPDLECAHSLTVMGLEFVLRKKLGPIGLSSIHALSFSMEKINSIIMLPSKEFNESLQKYLVQNPDVKFISKHSPLIDTSGRVHVFPTTIPEDRVETQNLYHKNLLINGFKIPQGKAFCRPVKKWNMLLPIVKNLLLEDKVYGHFDVFERISVASLVGWLYRLFIRLFCAIQLLRRSNCYFLYLGSDSKMNSQVIIDLMYEQQNS